MKGKLEEMPSFPLGDKVKAVHNDIFSKFQSKHQPRRSPQTWKRSPEKLPSAGFPFFLSTEVFQLLRYRSEGQQYVNSEGDWPVIAYKIL